MYIVIDNMSKVEFNYYLSLIIILIFMNSVETLFFVRIEKTQHWLSIMQLIITVLGICYSH